MQHIKAIRRLNRVAVRILLGQLKRRPRELRIGFDFGIGHGLGELSRFVWQQLKLRGQRVEISAFFRKRLCEVIGFIGKFLQRIDTLFAL